MTDALAPYPDGRRRLPVWADSVVWANAIGRNSPNSDWMPVMIWYLDDHPMFFPAFGRGEIARAEDGKGYLDFRTPGRNGQPIRPPAEWRRAAPEEIEKIMAEQGTYAVRFNA